MSSSSSEVTPQPTEALPRTAEEQASAGADSGTATRFNPTSGKRDKRPDLTQFEELTGRQLGEFKLIRRLGHGGMAEVYLAEQSTLSRQVAVKVLRSEFVADEVLLKRFQQEARAAGGLNHANIVQVYSVGEQDGLYFIAQEFVDGMNLREYLDRKGVVDVPLALKIMRQTASALQAADDAGIVHRDIKPENIMLTRKGDVKVADFGLAQLTHGDEKLNLTQVGMTMGTPLYMSPEQVNGKPLDRRTDIYSFGVTAYHMLCGQTPFRGETALAVAVQHLNNEPAALSSQRKELPDVVCQIVHRMMSKDPDERYQDAATLGYDVRTVSRALRDNPAAVSSISLPSLPGMPSQSALARFGRWFARHQVSLFIMAFVIAGATAAAVGWMNRPIDPLSAPLPADKRVKELGSAREQYLRALYLVDDVGAWQAVIDYFPDDRIYTPKAKSQLAQLYLRTNRYEAAQSIYRSFTLQDRDPAQKALGYAGVAVSLSLQGKHAESQRVMIDELIPIRQQLQDEEVQRLVRDAIERNGRQLRGQARKGLEELFQKTGNGQ